MEVIVSVNGCNVPNFVESKGNAKFRVNFRPREITAHNLSVRFNGDPVPGMISFIVTRITRTISKLFVNFRIGIVAGL